MRGKCRSPDGRPLHRGSRRHPPRGVRGGQRRRADRGFRAWLAGFPRGLGRRGGTAGRRLPHHPLRQPRRRCIIGAGVGLGLCVGPARRRLRGRHHRAGSGCAGARGRPRLGRGDDVGGPEPAGGRPAGRLLHLDLRSRPATAEPLHSGRAGPSLATAALRPCAVAGGSLQLHDRLLGTGAHARRNAGFPGPVDQPVVHCPRHPAGAVPSGRDIRRRRDQWSEDLPRQLLWHAHACCPRSVRVGSGTTDRQYPGRIRPALRL